MALNGLTDTGIQMKTHFTIGCCGIDCGLCPRFISTSASACPGCGGADFYEKHPACGVLTCCASKHGCEVCAECKEYPCKRCDDGKEDYDSFVTHKKAMENQEQIRALGLSKFIIEQKIRMLILEYMVNNFDNGRSKSYFCQVSTLMPLSSLKEVLLRCKEVETRLGTKEKNAHIRGVIDQIAEAQMIDLKLRKK